MVRVRVSGVTGPRHGATLHASLSTTTTPLRPVPLHIRPLAISFVVFALILISGSPTDPGGVRGRRTMSFMLVITTRIRGVRGILRVI